MTENKPTEIELEIAEMKTQFEELSDEELQIELEKNKHREELPEIFMENSVCNQSNLTFEEFLSGNEKENWKGLFKQDRTKETENIEEKISTIKEKWKPIHDFDAHQSEPTIHGEEQKRANKIIHSGSMISNGKRVASFLRSE